LNKSFAFNMSIETDSQECGIFSQSGGIAPIDTLQSDNNGATTIAVVSTVMDETEPLLPSSKKLKKHWYRARPLW
jgi:hypothetical protein